MTRDVLPNTLRSKKDALGKIVLFDRIAGDQITKDVIGEEIIEGYKEVSKRGNVIFSLNIPSSDGISQILKKGDIISIIRTKSVSLPYNVQKPDSTIRSGETNMVVAERVEIIDILEKEERRSSVLTSGGVKGLTIFIEIPREVAENLAVLEATKSYKVVLEKGGE